MIKYKKLFKDIDAFDKECRKLKLLKEDQPFGVYFKDMVDDFALEHEGDEGWEKTTRVKFNSLLHLIRPSVELARSKDLDAFIQAIAYLKVKLMNIADDAKDLAKILNRMQNKMDSWDEIK